MLSESKLPSRAWLIVGLLWMVGCLNYLDRVLVTTMRGSLVEAIPMTDAQFGLLTSVFSVGLCAAEPARRLSCGPFQPVAGDHLQSLRLVGHHWLTAHATTFPQLLATAR